MLSGILKKFFGFGNPGKNEIGKPRLRSIERTDMPTKAVISQRNRNNYARTGAGRKRQVGDL
jgi:hypothetical protein